MSTLTQESTSQNDVAMLTAQEQEGAALTMRLLESVGPALELLTIELGRRHGLYAAIDRLGTVTAGDLAAETGAGERQVHEWLEQQTIAGILVATAGPTRRYHLPSAYRAVLLDPTSPVHGAGLAEMFAGIAETFDEVAATFPGTGAVRFADFGPAVRHGLETIYRPGYTHALSMWMEQLPDVTARLERGGVILDAGCGTGWSTVALARRFPLARVVGVDLDAASVAEARRNAADAGVGERVTFVQADIADASALSRVVEGRVALATVFLALHDMNSPQRALASLAGMLEPGGAVMIGDAKVADDATEPAGPLDRMFSAFSVLHCLPATLAEGEGHAHGTVLRAPTVMAWSREAGLRHATRLPIEHPTWSFYRLDA